MTISTPPAVLHRGEIVNTRDGGAGSFRDALIWAQSHPGSTLRFAIPTSDPGYKEGVFTIRLVRPLPYITADLTQIIAPTQEANGYTGGHNAPGLFLDGSGISVPQTGLVIRGARCTVRNVAIGNFVHVGISVQGKQAIGNLIENCFIGTDAAGRSAAPNSRYGILIEEGALATIHSCLVSGNKQHGIIVNGTWQMGKQRVSGLGTSCRVVGCLVGTDVTGQAALPNGGTGIALLDGATSCDISQNVCAGNRIGIQLIGVGTSRNSIRANYIGLGLNNTIVPNTAAALVIQREATGNIADGNVLNPR